VRAFLDEIGASLKRIVARPQLFPIYLDETRRRICDRFSYSIIYREKEDVILILAVAHAKQRPGYWKKQR